MSSQEAFTEAVATITARIAGMSLDANLQAFLTQSFPPGGEAFDDLAELCRQGIDEGWLCEREQGGIRFGRIIKPGPGDEWVLGRRRGDERYQGPVSRTPERRDRHDYSRVPTRSLTAVARVGRSMKRIRRITRSSRREKQSCSTCSLTAQSTSAARRPERDSHV